MYAAFRFSPEPAVGLALLSEGADKLGEGGLAGEKAEGKSTSAGRRASERGMKGWLGAGCVLCAIAVL